MLELHNGLRCRIYCNTSPNQVLGAKFLEAQLFELLTSMLLETVGGRASSGWLQSDPEVCRQLYGEADLEKQGSMSTSHYFGRQQRDLGADENQLQSPSEPRMDTDTNAAARLDQDSKGCEVI